jgi:hypothetical protein
MHREWKPIDKRPYCECGHLWWCHKNNITPNPCDLCLNFAPFSLDGHTIEPVTKHILKEYCIGFKRKKL